MASIDGYLLLNGATANGDSAEVLVDRPGIYRYNTSIIGTGTTQLKFKPAGHSAYQNATGVSHTVTGGANGGDEVYLESGEYVKDNLSGASGATVTSTLNFVSSSK